MTNYGFRKAERQFNKYFRRLTRERFGVMSTPELQTYSISYNNLRGQPLISKIVDYIFGLGYDIKKLRIANSVLEDRLQHIH